MGEIATKNGSLSQWLDKIDATRNGLIESAKTGNRVAAAFAMADARCDLIESLSDEMIRAKLLRITDPKLAMVELANNPNDEDRVRVCAIAILSGFTPGEDQFAVFGGGKNPGKLYVKERGFRILFSHLGIVPEVRVSHPEYVAFGTAGKKVWKVAGSASCTYQGREYSVEFSGDELIGIPGYDTDNVAGIAAKARRRILQALWIKVSPVFTSEIDDDDVDAMPVTATQRIETAAEKPATQTREQIATQFELKRVEINKRLSKDRGEASAFCELWKAIADASTAEALATVGKDIAAAKSLFSERDVAELRQWYIFCGEDVK